MKCYIRVAHGKNLTWPIIWYMLSLLRRYYRPFKNIWQANWKPQISVWPIKRSQLEVESKCQLCQKEVLFLGHKVSEQGLSTDPNKIKAIKSGQHQGLPKKSEVFSGWHHIIENSYCIIPTKLYIDWRKNQKDFIGVIIVRSLLR